MKTSNKIIIGVLAGILLLGILPIFILKGNFTFLENERIRGNGDWKKETLNLSDFENIDLQDNFDVRLKQGDFSVEIEVESNLMEHLEIENADGYLILGTKEGVSLKSSEDPRIYISMPDLNVITVSGVGAFTSEGNFKTEDLEIIISGAADMELDLECTTLKTRISGAGDINLSGSADYFSSSNNGAGNINAYEFETKTTKVSINGAGDAKINATERIDANINGAGNVTYVGNPAEINKQINGFGNIERR